MTKVYGYKAISSIFMKEIYFNYLFFKTFLMTLAPIHELSF